MRTPNTAMRSEAEAEENPTMVRSPEELAKKLGEAEADYQAGRYSVIRTDEDEKKLFDEIEETVKKRLKNDAS